MSAFEAMSDCNTNLSIIQDKKANKLLMSNLSIEYVEG